MAEIVAVLPSLRLAARRWSRDQDAAEDLLQDTVERALETLATYQPSTNATAWMRTIMYRLAVDGSRRRQREARTRYGYAVEAQPAVQNPDEPADYEEAEVAPPTRGELEAAAQQLSEPFRETFRLRNVERLSYQAMAERLGVPIGTIAGRLYRARHMLRARLRPSEGERPVVSNDHRTPPSGGHERSPAPPRVRPPLRARPATYAVRAATAMPSL
jgi:RNA polymerase sigma-70 factor, ECF subfamily